MSINNPPLFRKIIFPNTYENYDVKYMVSTNEIKELYDKLPDNRKLLVFVSSKELGNELAEAIPDSVFLFAENEDDKLSAEALIQYNKIKDHESFDSKVLITTKLLDAGVNFKMKDLRDIVIATEESKEEFLQIIGRRRAVDVSRINLYVMKRDKAYFSNRRFNCIKKLKALYEIERCNRCIAKRNETFCINTDNSCCEKCFKNAKAKYFSNSDSMKLIDGLVVHQGQKIVINKMAEYKLKLMADYYDSLLEDFEETGEDAYIIRQLSWLGLENTYSADNYFSKENTPVQFDDLYNFLEKYQGTELNEEMQRDFRKEFQDFAVRLKLYTKRSENDIGLNKINQILKENNMLYQVESNVSSEGTVWNVIKNI